MEAYAGMYVSLCIVQDYSYLFISNIFMPELYTVLSEPDKMPLRIFIYSTYFQYASKIHH